MLRRLSKSGLGLLAIAIVCLGSAPAAARGELEKPLASELQSLVDTYSSKSSGRVGLAVCDLATGRQIAAVESDTPMIPASCQKVVTSAVALRRLGSDFQFTTSVYLRGPDIVVVGDFDPILGDPYLADVSGESIYQQLDLWAAAAAEALAGAKCNDLLLVSPGSSAGRHPDWPAAQHARWYSAPVTGLNFHSNCLDVTFGIENGSAVATVSPASRFMDVDSRVKVGSKHVWSLRTDDSEAEVVLTGSISKPARDPFSIAIDDPAMLLGRVFADRLEKTGVGISRSVRIIGPDQIDLKSARLISQTRNPLPAVMNRANKRSLNLAAEAMGLRSGDGSWHGSAEIASKVLSGVYGLDRSEFTIRDGGGLSKENRITPSAMCKLLGKLSSESVFVDSLAVSGVDGTMRKRLASASYRGRVIAKTGSLANVSALAGYVLDSDGKPAMAFAIFVNDIRPGKKWLAKDFQDALCRLLVDVAD